MSNRAIALLEKELQSASLADLPREITAERFLDIAKQAAELRAATPKRDGEEVRERLVRLRRQALMRHAAL